MHSELLLQPLGDPPDLGSRLLKALAADGVTAAWFASAWTKHSALRVLEPSLTRIRHRGGRTECLTGVDHGGATREALAAALDIFTEVHVFHDPREERTFHPKFSVVEGTTAATVFIGSSNLTLGGLYTNYELNWVHHLSKPDPEEESFLGELRRYYDLLRNDSKASRKLTHKSLAALVADATLRIGSEEAEQRERRKRTGVGQRTANFAAPDFEFTRPPARTRARISPAALAAISQAPPPPPVRHVVATWSKPLSASDSHQKKGGNQRVQVTLVQNGYPIDQTTWFRETLFSTVDWKAGLSARGRPVESAHVSFAVSVDRADAGAHSLKIEHSPARESGQSNYTTTLYWGSLASRIKSGNYQGWILNLDRLNDGSFRLSLDRPPTT